LERFIRSLILVFWIVPVDRIPSGFWILFCYLHFRQLHHRCVRLHSAKFTRVKIIYLIIQTPIPDSPDFATLRFHAGPPYEVSSALIRK
jgi:hypothetical protein